jgi:ABC-type antimicrobial peptide transport system permease subunit
VIVVNQSMANRYWPGEDAVGKRITLRSSPKEKDWIRVVGVVRDIRDQPESNAVRPAMWFPYAQLPDRSMFIAVRSNGDSAQVTTQLRLAVRRLDAELAISDLRLMNQIADNAVATQRFTMFLVGLFAVLALVLATIGIYGVISYSVNRRMGEFGLRMALGAKPWDLTRLILGQGLVLTLVGVMAGLLSAAGLTRLLGSLLYGVSGTDPLTFAAVALLALVTTMLACYVPARRAAAAADPMHSLRAG